MAYTLPDTWYIKKVEFFYDKKLNAIVTIEGKLQIFLGNKCATCMSRFLPVYIYISTEFVNMKKRLLQQSKLLCMNWYSSIALNTTYITYTGE